MTDLDLLCRETVESAHMPRVMVGRFLNSNIAGPQVAAVSGGEPSIPSPDADGAKMETAPTAPGRPCGEQECTSVKSGRAANNRWASIRPYCQNPDMCPGYGDKHCSACRKLMKTSEAA